MESCTQEGGTFFSLDPVPKGGLNLKSLRRNHLTSVRGPISYRIFFMAYYFSFLLSLDLLLTLKFTSNTLPTTQTFLHERKVLGVSNLVCKLKGSHHLKKWIIQTFSNFRHFWKLLITTPHPIGPNSDIWIWEHFDGGWPPRQAYEMAYLHRKSNENEIKNIMSVDIADVNTAQK